MLLAQSQQLADILGRIRDGDRESCGVPASMTPAVRNCSRKFCGRAMPQNAKHGSFVWGAMMSRVTLHTCWRSRRSPSVGVSLVSTTASARLNEESGSRSLPVGSSESCASPGVASTMSKSRASRRC